ncbi:MAG TPA: pantoate--beta-alanine ligase [Blastocatellia bacterium]|nr:pantoate--beta-alanine ligase [Blastocatellia bacterium]
MEIVTRAARMHSIVEKLAAEVKPVGYVPTMGSLHEGHLALVRTARRMTDVVVVSIFVNPTQFGRGEDFDRYPRDLARDADLLTPLGVDYIFAPGVEEIYPRNFSTFVTVEELSEKLEGASRPGHFRGVATVLAVLCNIVRPKFVFMGQKDAQQTVIVKKMVRDLHLPVEVVVVPTVREADGLALSSRNKYLSPEERRAAPVLYRSLTRAEDLFENGERSARRIIRAMEKEIQREPLAKVDYIAITDTERLDPIDDLSHRTALVSLAVRFGTTRLIDNVILNGEDFKSKSGRLKLG